jgi:myo-inositol-1(or 4)-monophosphatase
MSTPSLDRALLFAAQRHAGTLRDGKDPLPYITHVSEVVSNLRYVGRVTDPVLLTAAALHDLLEQESATEAEIKKQFGTDVLNLVKELTRTEPDATAIADLSRDEVWNLRAELLRQDVIKMSVSAQIIKLADRLANLAEAKREKSGKKLRRYKTATAGLLIAIPETVNPSLWRAIKKKL